MRINSKCTNKTLVKGTECVKVAQACPTLLRPHGLFVSLWDSPGQNTGVGSHSLLQGIFPIQGLTPDLPHCRWILYQLSYQGSPRILEWVAYPFSSRSSQPRNWTRVSSIAGGFFTSGTTRESLSVRVYSTQNPELDRLESESCSVVYDSLWSHGLYSPWNSPGQNTEWVVIPFSRESSQPRDQTQVSRIAGRFFTSWDKRDWCILNSGLVIKISFIFVIIIIAHFSCTGLF